MSHWITCEPLALGDLRESLIRQEETIIFALIERAQFRRNAIIYRPGAIPVPDFQGSFCDYLLSETERLHARVRRYTSPDEHAFSKDLPDPVLPPIRFPRKILPNSININNQVKRIYLENIIPLICPPGDCGNYGSSATCDVACLQAISKRIHYGKFVAEAKFQEDPEGYGSMIEAGDDKGIMDALTNLAVEKQLLERVRRKGATYGQDLAITDAAEADYKIPPDTIADIYRQWLIPLTKDVELQYLRQRLREA